MNGPKIVFYITSAISTLFFILWVGGIFVMNMFRDQFSHLSSDNIAGALFAPFVVFLISGIVAAVSYGIYHEGRHTGRY